MIDSDKLFKIGVFSKSHGINGEIILKTSDFDESLKENEPVFVFIDNLPVPFFIEKIKKQGQSKFIVKFTYYDSIKEIEELINKEVYLQISENHTYDDFYNIEDFTVYNFDNKIGKIIKIDDYNGNIVLTILNNEEKEILIPLNQDLIKDINYQEKTISFELPEGLLNI